MRPTQPGRGNAERTEDVIVLHACLGGMMTNALETFDAAFPIDRHALNQVHRGMSGATWNGYHCRCPQLFRHKRIKFHVKFLGGGFRRL